MSVATNKHTPGPWFLIGLGRGYFCVDANPGAHNHEVIAVPQKEANARLIAAAPALLEACRRALKEIRDGEPTIGLEEDLEFAIAKAEGTPFRGADE